MGLIFTLEDQSCPQELVLLLLSLFCPFRYFPPPPPPGIDISGDPQNTRFFYRGAITHPTKLVILSRCVFYIMGRAIVIAVIL
jgi:hypothetical protein